MGFLKGKTLLMSTHQTQYAPLFDAVVYLNRDGSLFLFSIVLLSHLLETLSSLAASYVLGFWTGSENSPPDARAHSPTTYFLLYLSLNLFSLFILFPRELTMTKASLRAATRIHDSAITRLFHAPLSFFDVTPTGRIVNRMSKDMRAVDSFIPMILINFLHAFFSVGVSVIGACFSLPWISLSLLPLPLLYAFINFRPSSALLRIRRAFSSSRSQIIHLFQQTLAGAQTIRAFDATPLFREKFYDALDQSIAIGFYEWSIGRQTAMLQGVLCLSLHSSLE